MNNQFQSSLKQFTLLIFWIIFPPLFLVFSYLWKIPKLAVRLVLTAVAPLTLIFLFFGLFQLLQYYYFNFERGGRTELEAKTGLIFPDYKTIEKRHFTFEPGFNGDFSMEYTVKLDTTNIREFYKKIDQKIIESEIRKEELAPTNYWNTENGDNYFFSHFNDPQDEDDQTLELHIDKKNAQIRISFGRM